MADKVFEKLKTKLSGAQKNVLMKDFTTYKIGGPAEYFFVAKTKDDLAKAVQTAKKMKLNVLILGGGSNILVSDKGVKGLVIKLEAKSCKLQANRVYAESGVKLNDFANFCRDNNLTGEEWAMGIPGTVGGAIFGNAQAFGTKISDSIKSVEALDAKTTKILNFNKEQCQFSLKNSIFKKNRKPIILSAVFKLKPGKREEINEKIKEYMNYRKKNHPMNFPSAGSVFVNPERNGEVIRAGFLIEKCGLKGKKIGGAQISEKHANFIINTGNAKAKDVLALMKLAKQKVKRTFGINLETEVQLVGF